MSEAFFGRTLIAWRKSEGLTQADLAHRIGVSQQAVSYWEREQDVPDRQRLDQIRALMAQSDQVAEEKAFIKNQNTIRAFADFDSMKMLGTSLGYAKVWPTFSNLIDIPLADYMIGELGELCHSLDIRKAIMRREITAVSGVSQRHFDIDMDQEMKHRWFIRFRKIGNLMMTDMIFEPCEAEAVNQIEEIIRPDALVF